MARVVVYTGEPGVIPVYECHNLNGLGVTIKTEPADTTEADEEIRSLNSHLENDDQQPDSSQQAESIQIQLPTSEKSNKSKQSNSQNQRKTNNVPPQNEQPAPKRARFRVGTNEMESLLSFQGSNHKLRSKTPINIDPTCDICFLSFTSEFGLKRHKNHFINHKLMCFLCHQDTHDPQNWLDHQLANHPKTNSDLIRHQCDYCVVNFLAKKQVQQHIYHYHNPFKTSTEKPSDLSIPLSKDQNKIKQKTSRKRKSRGCHWFSKKSKRARRTRKVTQETSTSPEEQEQPSTVIRDTVNHQPADVDDNVIPSTLNSSIQENRHSNRNSSRTTKDSVNQLIFGHLPTLDNLNKARTPISEPDTPLVKIHAIPTEVEALLSDFNGEPMKNIETNRENRKRKRQHSHHTASSQRVSPLTSSTLLNKENTSIHEPLGTVTTSTNFISDDPLKTPTPSSSPTRKWRFLRRRYKCRDCHVVVNRIRLPHGKENNAAIINTCHEASDYSDQDFENVTRPIGLELKNLEIAMKKFSSLNKHVDKLNCTRASEMELNKSDNVEKEGEEKIEQEVKQVAEGENSLQDGESTLASKKVTSTTTLKNIYRSSACRTRFTTKRKLVCHYLCFHTNSSNQECGVCRTRFSNSAKLKNHLLLHCIKIIASKQDRSPIDPKGPCETFKKKFICIGCKKRFWLSSCLNKHTEYCKFVNKKSKKPEKKMTEEEILMEELGLPANYDTETCARTDEKKFMDYLSKSSKTSSRANVVCEQENLSNIITTPSPSVVTKNIESVDTLENNKTTTLGFVPIPHQLSTKNPGNITFTPSSSLVPTNIESVNTLEKNEASKLDFIPVPYRFPNNSNKPNNDCTICNTQFNSRADLKEHLRRYNPRDITHCKQCNALFPTKHMHSAHKRYAHTPDSRLFQYRCLICNQAFSEKKCLRIHSAHIHQNKWCNDTNKLSDMEHSSFEKECPICKVVFTKYRRFVEHALYYFDEEDYICNICNSGFSGQYRAHHHNKTIHYSRNVLKKYTFYCSSCNDCFINESHWISHMLHVHDNHKNKFNEILLPINPSEKVFKCDICNEKFFGSLALTQHENEHINDGNFQCSQCDRKCRTLSSLNDHRYWSHLPSINTARMKCQICPEALPTEVSLINHLKHNHRNIHCEETEFRLEYKCTPLLSPCRSLQHSDINSTTLNEKTSSDSMEVSGQHNDSLLPMPESEEVGEMLCDSETEIILDPNTPLHIEYTCAICDEKFVSREELKIHRNIHSSTDFNYREEFQNSVELSKKNNTNEETQNNATVSNSLPESIEKEEPSIFVPDGNRETVEMLSANVNDTEEAPLFISDICSVQLEDYEKLTNSDDVFQENPSCSDEDAGLSQDASSLKFKCEECYVEFKNFHALENHHRRYSNSGPHVCQQCGRRFSWVKAYRNHMIKHEKRRSQQIPFKYFCVLCDEVFNTYKSTRMHFAHIHKILLSPVGHDYRRSLYTMPEDLQRTDCPSPQLSDMGNVSFDTIRQISPHHSSTLHLNRGSCIQEVDLTEDEDTAESSVNNSLSNQCYENEDFSNVEYLADDFQMENEDGLNVTPGGPKKIKLGNQELSFVESSSCHSENIQNTNITPNQSESQNYLNSSGNSSLQNDCNSSIEPENSIFFDDLYESVKASLSINGEPHSQILKSFHCRICSIVFINEASLRQHFNDCHAKPNQNLAVASSSSKADNQKIVQLINNKNLPSSDSSNITLETLEIPRNYDSSAKHSIAGTVKKIKKKIVLSKISAADVQDKSLISFPFTGRNLSIFIDRMYRKKK